MKYSYAYKRRQGKQPEALRHKKQNKERTANRDANWQSMFWQEDWHDIAIDDSKEHRPAR